jgi:hypothetical protein
MGGSPARGGKDDGSDVKCNYQIVIGSKAGGRYGYINEGPKDALDDAHTYHSHPIVPPSTTAKLSLAVVERQRAQKLAEQGSSREAIILELGLDARKHLAVERLVQYQTRKKRDSTGGAGAGTAAGDNASSSNASPSSSLNAAAAAAAVAAVAMGQLPASASTSTSSANGGGGLHSVLTAPQASTSSATGTRNRKRNSTADAALLGGASGEATGTRNGGRATRRPRLSQPAAPSTTTALETGNSAGSSANANALGAISPQQQQQAAARIHGIYAAAAAGHHHHQHNGSIHSDAWLTAPVSAPAIHPRGHSQHSHGHSHSHSLGHTPAPPPAPSAAPPPPPSAPLAHGSNGAMNGHHHAHSLSNASNNLGPSSNSSSTRENAELLRGLTTMFAEMMQNWLQAEERPDGAVGLQLKREWFLKVQALVEEQRLDLQSR